ncbi:response regulator [Planktothrix paucivesiculata]|uniref:histidine kinase n=1 Tax=Planktothrix paucivesiculata PCC 9631 TaxID=671071 RepID=A0A7Z9E1X3_9CYAN|nr:response regulator [Planktothrix paucivesiculata]VXD21789.1 Histidine kinase response regulator hybrid protein [Planktothrix paucivesiculata PCC 9631]
MSDCQGHILIVDDTPDNLRLLSKTLSEQGYEVQCAINGNLALMAVKHEPPDLILLDIKMPEMDGYEVCKRLKNQAETAEIPVIFLSALDDVFDKVKAFNVGGADYITKPFQVEEVFARIENQLTICRLQQQLQTKNIKLEQLNQELQRSNRELEEFAYIVSHDLQQPLQTITGFAELLLALKSEINLEEEAEEYVTPILEEGIRMQELIQNLLEYSRVGTKKRHFEITNCQEILRKSLGHLHSAIEESCAIITHETLPTLRADRIQLGQLFQNLIGNGIKYQRPNIQPKIVISVQEKPEEWLFRVEDNGIGIKPENFDRIFQVFQRLHTYQDYPGSGVGLAICKKIVERHQGKIWLESEWGIGTTFHFTLPKLD